MSLNHSQLTTLTAMQTGIYAITHMLHRQIVFSLMDSTAAHCKKMTETQSCIKTILTEPFIKGLNSVSVLSSIEA